MDSFCAMRDEVRSLALAAYDVCRSIVYRDFFLGSV